ncbi:hypothetical protein MMC22_002819 [Lobaria immixta]|nr:hypothetical protein [Lobaria immixta]
MGAFKDIEVHVVSSSDDRELVEYDNPKAITPGDINSKEKFIEAITGLVYHMKVIVKPSFKLQGADGIRIGVRIDGGVVNQRTYYDRDTVKQRQRTGSPFIDSKVKFQEGSIWRKSTYSFGSLNIDEELDIEKELLDRQASQLGSIKVWVQRATRKKLSVPVKRDGAEMYTPLTSADTSKEMVKKKHISHAMVPGETTASKELGFREYEYCEYTENNCHSLVFMFRYRSRMHLQLLGIIPQSPMSTSVEPEIREPTTEDQTSPMTDTARESNRPMKSEAQATENEDEERTQRGQREQVGQDRIQVLEKENRELYEQVQRLNAKISGFTTLNDQMTSFLQNMTGSQTTTAPSPPVVPKLESGATATPSASSPRSVSIKRERASTASNRSSKRPKVIDLTDD